MVKSQQQIKIKSFEKRILVACIFFACCQFLFSATSIFASGLSEAARLNSVGIKEAQNGDLIGAIRTWRAAIDFDQKNVHLYNNIGSALQRLGKFELAFQWYQASVKIQPTYWTYFNISLLYGKLGQIKDQIWALKRSLELNPDFDMGRRHLANLSQPEQLKVKEPISRIEVPYTTPSIENKNKPKHNIIAKYSKPEKQVALPIPRVKEEKVELSTSSLGSGGQVFLTFDGGADDDGFESIVKTLSQYNVKSTFFLTGKFVENYPEKTRRLLLEGHEIANHSMNHKDMKNWDKAQIASEINAAETAFKKVLGQNGAPFFRFPFGHQNSKVEKYVEELGYRPVYWHIDTIDWREDPVSKIISRVSKKLKSGSVVLMHLGSKNGAKALPEILRIVLARGFLPARLSDLNMDQIASLP